MKDKVNQIYCNDNQEVLKTFQDNSVDSLISDCPYALCDIDALKMIKEGVNNSGDFLNKKWLLPSVDMLKEFYRVLKTGSYFITTFTPRQDLQCVFYYRLLEAGFDINFSPIYWAYTSGFPKASNFSKSIDRHFDAEREVIGYTTQGAKSIYDGGSPRKTTLSTTLSTTPEAIYCDGLYSNSPKPAVEIIIIAQKPHNKAKYQQALTWYNERKELLDKGIKEEDLCFYTKNASGGVNFDKTRIPIENLQSSKYFPYPNYYKSSSSPYYILDVDDKNKTNYVKNLLTLENTLNNLLRKYNKKNVFELFNECNKDFWNCIGKPPIEDLILNILYPPPGTAPVVISPYAKDVPNPEDEFFVPNPQQIKNIYQSSLDFNKWNGIENNKHTMELSNILTNIFPFHLFRVDNQPQFYAKSYDAKNSYQMSIHDICIKTDDLQDVEYNQPLRENVNKFINYLQEQYPGEKTYVTTSLGIKHENPMINDGHAVSFRLNINKYGQIDQIDFNNSNPGSGINHIDAYCLPFLVAIKDRLSEDFRNKLNDFIEQRNNFFALKVNSKDQKLLDKELKNVFNSFNYLSPYITDLNLKTQTASTCMAHSFIISDNGVLPYNGNIDNFNVNSAYNKINYDWYIANENSYHKMTKNIPHLFTADGIQKRPLEKETVCYNTLVGFLKQRVKGSIHNIKEYLQNVNNLGEIKTKFQFAINVLNAAIKRMPDVKKKNVLQQLQIAFPSIIINNTTIEFNHNAFNPNSAYTFSQHLEKINGFLKTQHKIGSETRVNTTGLENWSKNIAIKNITNANLANIKIVGNGYNKSNKTIFQNNVQGNLNDNQRLPYSNRNTKINSNTINSLDNNSHITYANNIQEINPNAMKNLFNNPQDPNYNKEKSVNTNKMTIEVPKGVGDENFVMSGKKELRA